MTALDDIAAERKLDAECERIMAMTEEELNAELISQGLDPKTEVAKADEIINRAIAIAQAQRAAALIVAEIERLDRAKESGE